MPTYMVYDMATGVFGYKTSRPTNDPPRVEEGQAYIDGEYDPKTQMMGEGEQVIDKPEMAATLDKSQIVAVTEYATISGLPIPATVTISGNGANSRTPVDDGDLSFSLPVVGTYSILCEAGVTLPKTFSVEAMAA